MSRFHPIWWSWPVQFSPHVRRRMVQRGFSEVDIRLMLTNPSRVEIDAAPGRWLVTAHNAESYWHIVLEPDPIDQCLIVVTCYRLEKMT